MLAPTLRPPEQIRAGCGDGQPLFAQRSSRPGLVEERGYELLYLPPYSPDLNPIEAAFKIKGLLRKAEARTREALVDAMGPAISSITEEDAWGFFEHCGYSTLVQSL